MWAVKSLLAVTLLVAVSGKPSPNDKSYLQAGKQKQCCTELEPLEKHTRLLSTLLSVGKDCEKCKCKKKCDCCGYDWCCCCCC